MNENPFLRTTPVIPFSNATDAERWKDKNCYQCDNYESETTCEEEAGCKLAFYIDLGFIEGTIPLWAARDIGCEYDPLYGYVKLDNICRQKDVNLAF